MALTTPLRLALTPVTELLQSYSDTGHNETEHCDQEEDVFLVSLQS